MKEPVNRIRTNRFEQSQHAANISVQKRIGVENTSVNVRFCGKIKNRPGFLFFKDFPNKNLITNITADESDTILWKTRKIL